MPPAAAGLRPSLPAAMLLAAALAWPRGAGALSEFGIEGMGVVSTRGEEGRASVSPDGQWIVWASQGREGGAGGWDLWQAQRIDGRWQQPRPLDLGTPADEIDPMFSADGAWLYFASDRTGGMGGFDLYRAAHRSGDRFAFPEMLGAPLNSEANETSPAPDASGRRLMLARDGAGGRGGRDLHVAAWDGSAFLAPQPLPGINTGADEFDGAWLADGSALVFARSAQAATARLFVARCDGARYTDEAPLALSFNTEGSRTGGAVVDWHAPGELLVTGAAASPRAGQGDVYRMKAPGLKGKSGCVDQRRR